MVLCLPCSWFLVTLLPTSLSRWKAEETLMTTKQLYLSRLWRSGLGLCDSLGCGSSQSIAGGVLSLSWNLLISWLILKRPFRGYYYEVWNVKKKSYLFLLPSRTRAWLLAPHNQLPHKLIVKRDLIELVRNKAPLKLPRQVWNPRMLKAWGRFQMHQHFTQVKLSSRTCMLICRRFTLKG